MSESLSIDFFGTLNKDTSLWSSFMEQIRKDGVEVHIISGLWLEDLRNKLTHHGFYNGVHFDKIHSILHNLRELGADTWYDEMQDSWYSDNDRWWDIKAGICRKYRIKTHFDNDPRFEPYFKSIPTRFILIDEKIKEYIERLVGKMESEDDAWEEHNYNLV